MPSLRKKKISVFSSLIPIRGTINAHSPLPRWQSRPGRAEVGRAEAWNSRVMTRPRYFSLGFGTQPQHPRGLPGGGGETRRQHQSPPPRPAQPSRGGSGLRAGGSRRAAHGGDAPRGRGREPGSTHAPGGGTGAVAASLPFKNWKGGRGGRGERPGSSFHPETGGPAGNDEGRGRPGPVGNRVPRVRPRLWGKEPRAEQPGRVPPPEPAAWVDPRPGASRAPGGAASPGPAPRPRAGPPRPRLAGEGKGGVRCRLRAPSPGHGGSYESSPRCEPLSGS